MGRQRIWGSWERSEDKGKGRGAEVAKELIVGESSFPCYSSRLKRAAERRFQSRRRSRRLFFAFGDRSGAGGGEEPRDRWPVYIHFSVVASLGFLAPSAAARRRARPGGLGFRQSVLLSLQCFSGGCVVFVESSTDVPVRFVPSSPEKSGWSLQFGVDSSWFAWRSPAGLEVPDFLSLGDGLLGHSSIQVCIGFFGAPTVRALNLCVASLEVPSSSWESASSSSSGVSLFQGWCIERRLRWPASKMTGNILQGLGCNFAFIRGVFVRSACKLLYH